MSIDETQTENAMAMKIKIRGSRDGQGADRPMCGRDVGIFAVDKTGVERLLPVTRFVIECDGRNRPVRLTAIIDPDAIEIEGAIDAANIGPIG